MVPLSLSATGFASAVQRLRENVEPSFDGHLPPLPATHWNIHPATALAEPVALYAVNRNLKRCEYKS